MEFSYIKKAIFSCLPSEAVLSAVLSAVEVLSVAVEAAVEAEEPQAARLRTIPPASARLINFFMVFFPFFWSIFSVFLQLFLLYVLFYTFDDQGHVAVHEESGLFGFVVDHTL